MAQNSNQFAQTVEKGMLDLAPNAFVLGCIVDSGSATLVPGQAVKLVNVASKIPVVTAVTVDTDDIFGFVPYDVITNSYAAGANVDIAAFQGNIMYMEAAAAFAPMVKLGIVVSGSTVQTAVSTDRIIGVALDKATNIGDLVRVYINLPGAVV